MEVGSVTFQIDWYLKSTKFGLSWVGRHILCDFSNRLALEKGIVWPQLGRAYAYLVFKKDRAKAQTLAETLIP